MANYLIDPAVLQPHLPYGTELDIWQGRCYVSLVGFLFRNTRVLGIAVPRHTTFEEVNLRFYVKRIVAGEVRRGVSFIQELVPRPAITLIANTLYREKYITRPTRHRWHTGPSDQIVDYGWQYGKAWSHLKVRAGNQARPILPDTEEDFILEHYWGYSQLTPRKTGEYRVEHPTWQTYPVLNYDIDVDFADQYGVALTNGIQVPPVSVFLAEGSEIMVRKGRRIGS